MGCFSGVGSGQAKQQRIRSLRRGYVWWEEQHSHIQYSKCCVKHFIRTNEPSHSFVRPACRSQWILGAQTHTGSRASTLPYWNVNCRFVPGSLVGFVERNLTSVSLVQRVVQSRSSLHYTPHFYFSCKNCEQNKKPNTANIFIILAI